MNTKIFFSLMAAAAVSATLNGCDDNAWNDKLDGFKDKENEPLTEVQTIEYTMTDADYASVSSNSANQTLAGEELKNALANVGKQKCFSEQIPAEDYAPAILASKYYYLDNGSAVNLTFRQSSGLPAYLADAAAAELYTVTEDDYKSSVWESDEDFVNGFAPMKPASRYLARILAANVSDDAKYCIVSYNESNQNPVFGNVGGDTPQPEPWKPGNTIGQAALDAAIDCQAVVTGICAQGYIVTDNSGSILVYMGSSFDASSVQLGQQMNISGTIGAYNKGLQITGATASVEVVGTQAVTYPTPEVINGAKLDELGARTANELAKYVSMTGKVVVSGNNINIEVEGAATTKGSVYQGTPAQKALFTDGETVTVTGWFIAIAGGNRYANMVVTSVNGKPVAAARHRAAAVEVPMTAHNAVYAYESGRWTVASDFVVLQPGDYAELGQNYQNLTNANKLLPIYLKQKFPYASAEAVKNVLYLYYNSSSKETYYVCDQYTYNGSEWTLNDGIQTVTRQFVKNDGKWMFDPSVVITLPSGRNQAFSATYYQACVDWVFEHICKPLGQTVLKDENAPFYISKYGNNDYYSGASAYQNNVDIRGASAREQYAAGFEGMTDEEISELIKKRFFEEVFLAVIEQIHSDVEPIPGLDFTYTFNFYAYNGSTIPCQAVYKVVGKGKFEPVKCTWGVE